MHIVNHEDKSGFTIIDGEKKTTVKMENFYSASKLDDMYISVVSDTEGYTRKCLDKFGREVFSVISGQNKMRFLDNEIVLDCNLVTADLYCPEEKLVLLANKMDKTGKIQHYIYVYDKNGELLNRLNEPAKTDEKRIEWCSVYFKNGEMFIKSMEYFYSDSECYERNELHFRLDMIKYSVEKID